MRKMTKRSLSRIAVTEGYTDNSIVAAIDFSGGETEIGFLLYYGFERK